MKFLIDMPVTPDAAPHLRAAGHDAIHAVGIGLARSSDNELLRVARREERVIITADLDYPRLIALQQADRPGIILFRGDPAPDSDDHVAVYAEITNARVNRAGPCIQIHTLTARRPEA